MATFNGFEGFIGSLGLKGHNLNTDTINFYLSNATPSASADTNKSDLAEISTGNGYTGPVDSSNTFSETGGTGTLSCTDATVTASGGSIGPFRYVVHYNDTNANDALICSHDYGSALTLLANESFTVDYGSSLFTMAFA